MRSCYLFLYKVFLLKYSSVKWSFCYSLSVRKDKKFDKRNNHGLGLIGVSVAHHFFKFQSKHYIALKRHSILSYFCHMGSLLEYFTSWRLYICFPPSYRLCAFGAKTPSLSWLQVSTVRGGQTKVAARPERRLRAGGIWASSKLLCPCVIGYRMCQHGERAATACLLSWLTATFLSWTGVMSVLNSI